MDNTELWTRSVCRQKRFINKNGLRASESYGKHTIINACVSEIKMSMAKQPVAGWVPATSELSLVSLVSSGFAANSVALATGLDY